MHFNAFLTVLVAAGHAVQAAPSSDSPKTDALLRLVKTSEEDPGQWVTEEQKFERFTSKRIGFVDITDIQVSEPCRKTSLSWNEQLIGSVRRRMRGSRLTSP